MRFPEFKESFWDDQSMIHCPFCDDYYAHLGEQKHVKGWEDGGSSTYRQGHYEVTVWCEQNQDTHRWKYIFGEHKGHVFIKREMIKNE